MKDAPRVGDYELIDLYAVGGSAQIFRARDTRSGDIVCIKRVRGDDAFDPERIAGFMRECQLAMMFKHKNLIRGLARGSISALDYVVLEYVDGQDLGRILERAQAQEIQIPLSFSTHIVSEILDGLHHAHELKDSNGESLGLVHRDLTPRNVFIRYDGEIRVGDFGASIMTATEIPDEIMGSPGYLSPEQARLEPLDRRTDVFAVGCILYELLVGAPAFNVENKKDAQILRMHQTGTINPIPRDVPEALSLVVEIACSRDPEDRYPSAAEMRSALMRTEVPPNIDLQLGIATLVRRLFHDEFHKSRLPGTPLVF
jgi:serine/threonine-protein kinase